MGKKPRTLEMENLRGDGRSAAMSNGCCEGGGGQSMAVSGFPLIVAGANEIQCRVEY